MKIEKENVPQSECPVCFHRFDSASCLNEHGAQPQEGDVTLCIGCQTVLIFEEKMQPRPITDDEFEALHPLVKSLINETREVIKFLQEHT